MSTFERVREIIVEQLGAEPGDVKLEALFVEDLKADSLDLVELIMTFEEKLGIEISDEEAESLRSVGDAVTFIDAKGASASV
jgi:acyl carrier protein